MTPILFYGDSPDLQTGLGRIGRDLAVLVSSLPEFRVGYLGRGARFFPGLKKWLVDGNWKVKPKTAESKSGW